MINHLLLPTTLSMHEMFMRQAGGAALSGDMDKALRCMIYAHQSYTKAARMNDEVATSYVLACLEARSENDTDNPEGMLDDILAKIETAVKDSNPADQSPLADDLWHEMTGMDPIYRLVTRTDRNGVPLTVRAYPDLRNAHRVIAQAALKDSAVATLYAQACLECGKELAPPDARRMLVDIVDTIEKQVKRVRQADQSPLADDLWHEMTGLDPAYRLVFGVGTDENGGPMMVLVHHG